MKTSFYGREDILEQFSAVWKRKHASLIACRGRRRIGTSTLIAHFATFNDARLFAFEGLSPHPKMRNEDQLAAFGRQLSEQAMTDLKIPQSWFDAFRMLADAIPSEGKVVVLLDEISWMGKFDPNFPGELKYAWDKRFHDRTDLIFVICGSVSSWIEDNILSNTGFVGRVSLDIVVPELPLHDCMHFWGPASERISPHEALDVLSVTGGVPRYLEEIDPALSADENIKRMCFRPNGFLYRDFNDIFTTVFNAASPLKRSILSALANGSSSGSDLAAALGIARNGQFSKTMKELEMAGFVSGDSGFNPESGCRSREIRYRLKDNYSRFYLKYVEPHKAEIENGRYEFASLENLPEWNTIMGLQFENLVVNNYRTLLPALHLNGVQIFSAAPFRRIRSDSAKGVQIDLLIQTSKSVMLVEIKRQAEIGEEVEREMAEKASRLRIPKGMSVRTALVYAGRLSKAVMGSGYFDAIVPAEKLLHSP